MADRNIGHYLVSYDGATEEVDEIIRIDQFHLDEFREAFAVPPNDPEMHDRYAVGPDDIRFLRPKLAREVEFEFAERAYFIEALQTD
ncbi:MAG: hypothetical protein KDD64_11895 [Bdellovibrionales bacterium]|nr:hypothetical protein [Bdellovibrionales bacterium]